MALWCRLERVPAPTYLPCYPRPLPTPTRPRGCPPGGPPTLVCPLQRPVLYCAGGHLVPNFFFRIACAIPEYPDSGGEGSADIGTSISPELYILHNETKYKLRIATKLFRRAMISGLFRQFVNSPKELANFVQRRLSDPFLHFCRLPAANFSPAAGFPLEFESTKQRRTRMPSETKSGDIEPRRTT